MIQRIKFYHIIEEKHSTCRLKKIPIKISSLAKFTPKKTENSLLKGHASIAMS